MNIIKTPIEGLLVIEPQVFKDARGYFVETYNEQRYREAGIDAQFVQDNQSCAVLYSERFCTRLLGVEQSGDLYL